MTPWTEAYQAPPSLGFSRQEYWSGVPVPSPDGLHRYVLWLPQKLSGKESACSTGQRRQWHPTPVLLPGKSHGWRSLVGCSPWGRKELDTTEQLHFHFSFSCIGEGNNTPLQYSCLENPRDRGDWWAAVYGVAQSQTRLT